MGGIARAARIAARVRSCFLTPANGVGGLEARPTVGFEAGSRARSPVPLPGRYMRTPSSWPAGAARGCPAGIVTLAACALPRTCKAQVGAQLRRCLGLIGCVPTRSRRPHCHPLPVPHALPPSRNTTIPHFPPPSRNHAPVLAGGPSSALHRPHAAIVTTALGSWRAQGRPPAVGGRSARRGGRTPRPLRPAGGGSQHRPAELLHEVAVGRQAHV